MNWELFESCLSFLARSGIHQVRLLGGEPTLHPEFPRMVRTALEREFRVLVFSNVQMPETALACLEQETPERVGVLANALESQAKSAKELDRQREVLRRLGTRATLSASLSHPGVDLKRIFLQIEELGLARRIRLGLAHPSFGGSNAWLRPRQYEAVGRQLAGFAEECHRRGIVIDFDCGFTPCMFPAGVLEMLGITAAHIGQRCSPIVDILSDGRAIHCYPLAVLHSVPEASASTAEELRDSLGSHFAPYRAAGVFKQCSSCAWKERGDCSGGCLAVAMERMNPRGHAEAQTTAPKAKASQWTGVRWSIPYIDQPVEFWSELREEFPEEIGEVYLPLPIAIVGSGRPPQPSSHVWSFLRSGVLPVNVVVNPVVLSEPVEVVAPRIILALREWCDHFGIVAATVADLLLAAQIRKAFPDMKLTASTLLEVANPAQIRMMEGVFDSLVPSTRITRNLEALRALRKSFKGRIKLLVNESCLPGCLHRTQHFYEMAGNVMAPASLCTELLKTHPWLRLTGGWILPQHIHLFDGIYDELKLAGRASLNEPSHYRRVIGSYIRRVPLQPHEIGGGPASVTWPMEIPEEYYRHTLYCGMRCDVCSICMTLATETLKAVEMCDGNLERRLASDAALRILPSDNGEILGCGR